MCTSVNVGLVTSSSAAAPSPATIPLVSVVFPLPSSPVSSSSDGASRRFANSLPHAMVCSADRVMTSSPTPLQLPQKFPPCHRYRASHVAGHDPGQIGTRRRNLGGRPMQIHAERQNLQPIAGLELPGHRRQHSGQHV